MCDCYIAECKYCREKIPVHIGDFNYPSVEVEVFCKKHIPDNNVTIFEQVTVPDSNFNRGEEWYKEGWKCAFRLCDGEVEPSAEDVGPNTVADYKVIIL